MRVVGFIKKFRVLGWLFGGFLGGCLLVSIVGNTAPVPAGLYFVFALMVAAFFFWTGRRTAKDLTAQAVSAAVAHAEAAAHARSLAMAHVVVNNGEQSRSVIDSEEDWQTALEMDRQYDAVIGKAQEHFPELVESTSRKRARK